MNAQRNPRLFARGCGGAYQVLVLRHVADWIRYRPPRSLGIIGNRVISPWAAASRSDF